MGNLFHYDHPLWRWMGTITDLCFLTVLWAVFSLPIVTIGASTTALYDVSLKLAGNEECYLFRSFWKSFKENFKQSTMLWLLMMAFGLFLGGGLYRSYHAEFEGAAFVLSLYVIMTIWYACMLLSVFPLAARLDTGLKNLLLMTFMMMFKNLSWVLFMVVLGCCIIALGIFVFWPILLISAGGIAFIYSKLLESVIFPKYGWNLPLFKD